VVEFVLTIKGRQPRVIGGFRSGYEGCSRRAALRDCRINAVMVLRNLVAMEREQQ